VIHVTAAKPPTAEVIVAHSPGRLLFARRSVQQWRLHAASICVRQPSKDDRGVPEAGPALDDQFKLVAGRGRVGTKRYADYLAA